MAKFGGYQVSFLEVQDVSLGQVFGKKPISTPEMTKKLWAFIKENNLGGKGKDEEGTTKKKKKK